MFGGADLASRADPTDVVLLIHPRSNTAGFFFWCGDIFTPYYAGAAPGSLGVQQVNLTIPSDLGVTTTNVAVCAVAGNPGQRICSPPAPLTLK